MPGQQSGTQPWADHPAQSPTEVYEVLIVQIEFDISAAVTDLLQRDGYRARTVRNGREALTEVRSGLYRAVLLDLSLPDMDGLLLLGALTHIHPTISVIVLTCVNTQDTIHGALALGAEAYVVMPYSTAELRAIIAATMATPRMPHSGHPHRFTIPTSQPMPSPPTTS